MRCSGCVQSAAETKKERGGRGESNPNSDLHSVRSLDLKKKRKKKHEAHRQARGLLHRAGRGLRRGAFPAGTPGARQARRGAGMRVGVEWRAKKARGKRVKISKKKNSIKLVFFFFDLDLFPSERSLGAPTPALSLSLARARAALLPSHATPLTKTKNPTHKNKLKQTNKTAPRRRAPLLRALRARGAAARRRDLPRRARGQRRPAEGHRRGAQGPGEARRGGHGGQRLRRDSRCLESELKERRGRRRKRTNRLGEMDSSTS